MGDWMDQTEAEADRADAAVRTRVQAMRSLGALGRDASPADSKKVAEGLTDVYMWARAVACEELGQMGAAGRMRAAELATMLGDSEPSVREAALQALGQMGTSGLCQLVAVANKLCDGDGDVRTAAEATLEKFQILARELNKRKRIDTPAAIERTLQQRIDTEDPPAAKRNCQRLKFFHGTSWERAQQIKQHGFIKSESGCLGQGVYVARKEKATKFAQDARHGGTEGGLAEVPTYHSVPLSHRELSGVDYIQQAEICRKQRHRVAVRRI